MALNKTDTTILYLLGNDRQRVYKQIVDDTEAGKTGLATAQQMQQSANQLTNIIQQNAAAQAIINQQLDVKIEQESGVLLYIDSSRGTVFKRDSIQTLLTVVIYKSGERITNATRMHEVFGNTSRLEWSWMRIDDDRFGVISASDSRILDDGFTLVCTNDDVDTKVTFNCALIVD